jgi:hypothetical protein
LTGQDATRTELRNFARALEQLTTGGDDEHS